MIQINAVCDKHAVVYFINLPNNTWSMNYIYEGRLKKQQQKIIQHIWEKWSEMEVAKEIYKEKTQRENEKSWKIN
jgi:hypothetical protein